MISTNEQESGDVPQRDALGRWRPGVSGNARGRRPGLPTFLRCVEDIAEQQGVTVEQAIGAVVEMLLRRAANGDLEAAKLVMARVPDVAERAGLLVVDDDGAPGRFAPDANYVAEVDRVLAALAPPGVAERVAERIDRENAEREAKLAKLLA